MSYQPAPVDFCPHRTAIEHHVQYAPIGDVQYYERVDSEEEGMDGDDAAWNGGLPITAFLPAHGRSCANGVDVKT